MILALSIVAGILVAGLSYRVLFYDANDFWDGCGKFLRLFRRKPRWIWQRNQLRPPSEEDFADESWSSGIRFFVFLAVSIGCGYLAYQQLQKFFG